MKSPILTLLLVLLLGTCVRAQTPNKTMVRSANGALAGRVLDEANLPLAGATLNLDDKPIMVTDQDGFFTIADLPSGDYQVKTTYIGFVTDEQAVTITAGTAPQLSNVMINGERIPSAEAEVRSVQLDLFPADMVQAVEVSKAVTPDMDADAIGGSVNLVTRA